MTTATATKTVSHREFRAAEREFVSRVASAIDELGEIAGRKPSQIIEAYVRDSWNAEPVRVELSWYAIGTVDVQSAETFAKAVAVASGMLAEFPYAGYTIEY